MTDLYGGRNAIAVNPSNTVGVMVTDGITTNETRRSLFSPHLLVEWAESVADAYEDDAEVEVVFTPGKPMTAVQPTDKEAKIGIGVCPREYPEDDDGD